LVAAEAALQASKAAAAMHNDVLRTLQAVSCSTSQLISLALLLLLLLLLLVLLRLGLAAVGDCPLHAKARKAKFAELSSHHAGDAATLTKKGCGQSSLFEGQQECSLMQMLLQNFMPFAQRL
jgi:hypothetical protein